MTQFDSLPTAFSQAPQQHAKPRPESHSETGQQFAQYWSTQGRNAKPESAEPLYEKQKRMSEDDTQSETDDDPAGLAVGPEQNNTLRPAEQAKETAGASGRQVAASIQSAAPKNGAPSALTKDVSATGVPTPNGQDAKITSEETLSLGTGPTGQRTSGEDQSARLQADQLQKSDSQVIKGVVQLQSTQPAQTRLSPEVVRKDPRPHFTSTPPLSRTSNKIPIPADMTIQKAAPLVASPLLEAAQLPSIPTDADAGLPASNHTQIAQQTPSPLGMNRSYAPQAAQQIAAALVQASGARTEIMLNPEELGRVRIAMTAADAGLTVTILAERPETADLMRRNIDLLTRELRDMGYDNLTFNFENQSGNSSEQDGDNAPRSDASVDALPADAATTSMRVALSGGLDLKL